ncbi:MAG: UDP-diphosphatase, partial [Flavobacteriales bacterium]|nr:UDP-diphosphatase [Flavobacteriales bacterium]
MIEEFKYFLLGLIQGVAEFFPISSSGHLLLLSSILDVAEKNPLLLSITVHFATTLSTIVIYHNKLKKILFGIIKQKDKVAISYVLKILI